MKMGWIWNLEKDRYVILVASEGVMVISLRKQPSFFAPGPSGVSREGRLRFTAENSILMT